MAENKKSFVLYCDLIHTVSKMPSDKAGELFKHILEYVNDKNPETDDLIIQLTFEPIKQQLKRDLTAWEIERLQRSIAGKKGMESRWGNKDNSDNTVITEDKSVIPVITNITDNVTVTVNDTVNEIEKKDSKPDFEKKSGNTGVLKKEKSILVSDEKYKKFIEWFNENIGKIKGNGIGRYQPVNGKTYDNFKILKQMYGDMIGHNAVHVMKKIEKDEYHKINNFKYITPEFFTRKDKFERYLNE